MHLPPYPVQGEPLRAAWGRQVVDMLRSLIPSSGPGIRVSRGPGGTCIASRAGHGGASGGAFSGIAYVAGIKTEDLNEDADKPWVKCVLGDGTASEQYGPPPDPFPDGEEWYEKANTYGDIHVVRA